MKIPDLLAAEVSTALMVFDAQYRRGSEVDGDILFDWTLTMGLDIADDDEIDEAPAYMGDIAQYLRDAREGRDTSELKREPLDGRRDVRVTITHPSHGQVVVDAAGHLRKVWAKTPAKGARFRCVLHLLKLPNQEYSANVLACLDRIVTIQLERVQGELFGDQPQGDQLPPEAGETV